MGGGPLSWGNVIGAAVAFGLYLLIHGTVASECLGPCAVEAAGWIAVGGIIGGIGNSFYDEYRRRNNPPT